MGKLTEGLVNNGKKIGLRLNVPKTKYMMVGPTLEQQDFIKVDGEEIERVDNFVYLGSCLCEDGNVEKDVKIRIGKGGATFQKMKNVWRAKKLSLKLKLRIYNAIILPTLLYASETWKVYKSTGKRLDAFHRKCLRSILRITWRDKVTNEVVMKRTGAQEVQTIMKVRRMRYLGHVMRMDPQRLTHTVSEWNPIGGKISQMEKRVLAASHA